MYMQGNDLQCADYDKRTALHLAAAEGHAEVVRFLLHTAKVRADPKDRFVDTPRKEMNNRVKFRWNRTPLQDAKAESHTACINLLEKSLLLSESQEDEAVELESPPQTPMKIIESTGKNKTLPLHLQLGTTRQTSVAASIHASTESSSDDEDEEEEDFRIRLEQKQKELKAYGNCRNYSGVFVDGLQGNPTP